MFSVQFNTYKPVPQNSCKTKGLERHFSDTDLAKIHKLSQQRLIPSPTMRYRGILDENKNAFKLKVTDLSEEVNSSQETEVSCCGKILDMFFSVMVYESRWGVSYPPGLTTAAPGCPI